MYISSKKEFNARRNFLKKAVYTAPVLIVLGSLDAKASDGDDTHGGNYSNQGASTLSSCSNNHSDNSKHKYQNNGWGNGDQDAPGNSLNHNSAENKQKDKDKVNHKGVETHGGSEKDIGNEGHHNNNHEDDN